MLPSQHVSEQKISVKPFVCTCNVTVGQSHVVGALRDDDVRLSLSVCCHSRSQLPVSLRATPAARVNQPLATCAGCGSVHVDPQAHSNLSSRAIGAIYYFGM